MVDGKYQTPTPFRMGIESRLHSEVERTGMDSQRLRQLLAFDRFMARLFATLQRSCIPTRCHGRGQTLA
jgi:hypothetical protein